MVKLYKAQKMKKKKGFVMHLAIDGLYCGFGFQRTKTFTSLRLGYMAIRLYFVDEEYLTAVTALVAISKVVPEFSLVVKDKGMFIGVTEENL